MTGTPGPRGGASSAAARRGGGVATAWRWPAAGRVPMSARSGSEREAFRRRARGEQCQRGTRVDVGVTERGGGPHQ